ncbi:MAG: hypothetical protein JXQ74_00595 [Alphaproteobacteria bacterium]|nr:hypothetical protein [Alphaproteobacteria bacterium]
MRFLFTLMALLAISTSSFARAPIEKQIFMGDSQIIDDFPQKCTVDQELVNGVCRTIKPPVDSKILSDPKVLTFCATQPSTLNSTASKIYYYAAGNCTIKHMPTACASDYTLKNANTPNAICARTLLQCDDSYDLVDAGKTTQRCVEHMCPTSTYAPVSVGTAVKTTKLVDTSKYCFRKVAATCNAGYYLNGYNCATCPAGTYSAAGASSCSACPTGQTSAAEASSCSAITCPAGKYLSGSSCLSCAAGTYSTATSNTCSACPTGQTSAAGASSCSAIACPSGKYLSGSSCLSCDPGYKVNTAKTGCDKIMCATQPSTANVATDKSDFYYSGGACWLNKVPLTCNTGFNLVNPNTDKAACTAVAKCSTQPSTANASKTSSNVFYAGGNCTVTTMPTDCETGYSLTHAGTDKAVCSKLPNCSVQPSTANSTATSKDFYYGGGKCWIDALPTACTTGFVLENGGKNTAVCAKAAACSPQPSTANSTKVAPDDFFIDGCWVTGSYATECDAGYLLKDVGKNTARCEKAPSCSTQPVLTGSTKTAENVYDASEKCWLEKTPTECAVGHTLKDAGKNTARCEKAANCSIQPSVSNASKQETNIYDAKSKCFIKEMPTDCNSGFTLKYEGTNKARCEEIKKCRRLSTANVKTFKDNFFYEKGECLIEKLPIECDDGYALQRPETDKAVCSKVSKGSSRN